MDRKDLILDTFIRLVGRFGVDKTNLQDVARELGISSGVIHLEYSNKDTLIKACFSQLGQRFIKSCASIIEQDLPPEQLLYHFIQHIFLQMDKFILENRGFYQYVKEEGYLGYYQGNENAKTCFKQEILSLLVSILEKGSQKGIFEKEALEEKAKLILDSFYVFFVQLILTKRNVETILVDVQKMYNLLLNGIKRQE